MKLQEANSVTLLFMFLSFYGPVSSAFAADTIKVNKSATYQLTNSSSTKMQEQCTLDTQIVESLVRAAKGKVEVTDQNLSKVRGKTLEIAITEAYATGGGAMSGPKWAYVRVTLKEDGRVIDEFRTGGKTGGGGFTACSSLEKVGKSIGGKIAKRLVRPPRKHRGNADGGNVDDDSDKDTEDGGGESTEPAR